MEENNKHSQPFILVAVVLLLLILFSQFNTQLNLFGYQTKKIALLADIMQVEQKHTLTSLLNKSETVLLSRDKTAVDLPKRNPVEIVEFNSDSTSSLAHFFTALNELKKHKRKVRIAYFGDSMIEGDLITQDVRECFQAAFGGDGVGFMPITSIVAGFRASIQHSFEGWTVYNLLESAPKNHLLGISGFDFVPDTIQTNDSSANEATSWVKYAAVNRKHLNRFYVTKLLYGKSDADNAVFINRKKYSLNEKSTVNQLVIQNGAGCQSINAKFLCKSPLDIFGFSMESDSGVFVDNFSFRGNSGMPITRVAQSTYAATNACLNYDLVILEYGLNVVSPGVTNYDGYLRGMSNAVKHMHKSFPEASILLISIGDKSSKLDGIYATDTSVPILVNIQQQIAEKNSTAFWSLYDAMGGKGSMINWVEGDTALANKDYTHFNFKGAHKVGKLVYQQLMKKYSDYNKNKNQISLN